MKNTSIKSKIGIGLVIMGFICPLFGLVVPFLGFSAPISTALVTFFIVGGPELFLLMGGILAGKEGVQIVSDKFKKILGLPEGKYPSGRIQYNIGIALFLLWFILAIFPNYILELFPITFVERNLLWISLVADVLLFLSIFGFGGHQMITKMASVFKWEDWTLPSANEKN